MLRVHVFDFISLCFDWGLFVLENFRDLLEFVFVFVIMFMHIFLNSVDVTPAVM